jgi:ParB family chromosome partitioning protein
VNRPSGLGRGLSALLPEGGPGQSGVLNLNLNSILSNPRQPRSRMAEDELEELAASVAQVGVLQPVLVRPASDGHRYELVAGERRLRAAERAGLSEIPAIVRRTGDEQLLTEALVENIHRTDLDPLEEALAYQQLLEDFGVTHDELAGRLGRSRSAISNSLRLLNLPAAVQQRVADRELNAGHARALLALPDAEAQEQLAERVAAEGLSVRAVEETVRAALEEPPAGDGRGDGRDGGGGRRRTRSPYEDLQQRLSDALATKVQITGTQRRGRVVIDYAGTEDLERLLQVLSRGSGHNLVEEPPLR